MEKPEEERSLLLKCLPPVGNIFKQSGTKTPRTCSLQNVPKGDFFQSRLAASKLLPHLEQQSRCQNIEWLKLARPPTRLKSRTVHAECLNDRLHSQLLPVPASRKSHWIHPFLYRPVHTNYNFGASLDSYSAPVLICKVLPALAGFCRYTGQTKNIVPPGPFPTAQGKWSAGGKTLPNPHLPCAAPYNCSPTLSCHADPNQRTWVPLASRPQPRLRFKVCKEENLQHTPSFGNPTASAALAFVPLLVLILILNLDSFWGEDTQTWPQWPSSERSLNLPLAPFSASLQL